MKKFIPLGGHVEIKPIIEGGIIQRQERKYEEKGTVIQWDPELVALQQFKLEVGDIVYFDGWLSAKYPIDESEEERYLVKYEDIRGFERNYE